MRTTGRALAESYLTHPPLAAREKIEGALDGPSASPKNRVAPASRRSNSGYSNTLPAKTVAAEEEACCPAV